jgi:PAS domain S-box-containing protein
MSVDITVRAHVCLKFGACDATLCLRCYCSMQRRAYQVTRLKLGLRIPGCMQLIGERRKVLDASSLRCTEGEFMTGSNRHFFWIWAYAGLAVALTAICVRPRPTDYRENATLNALIELAAPVLAIVVAIVAVIRSLINRKTETERRCRELQFVAKIELLESEAIQRKRFHEGAVAELEIADARVREAETARSVSFNSLHVLEAARQTSIVAQQTASDRAARIDVILDTVVDAIITIDEQGIVESLNHAAERLFGYPAVDLVGNNINLLMPSLYREEHDSYFQIYHKSGISQIVGIGREVTSQRADGTTFPAELAVSEVWVGGRRLFTGIVHDISDLKRTLRQLAVSHRELAQRARQIEQFNFELSRSNEELKQFAYVASHDLQEPLRKVVAFCQLLESEYKDRLDENARNYIRFAVDGAYRMNALVTDLLGYSRIQTQGKQLEPTGANEVCDEAIENLSLTIQDAGAHVIRRSLPTVHADSAQLIRLFQNLIANAIKYRSDEPPRVEITAEERSQEWLFRVSDNGMGIDPKYHERIFVIFQRLHSREEYGGTGIGLAVCQRIVERAGGRIWVESSVGAGSTFCFTVPKSHHSIKKGPSNNDDSTLPAIASNL